MKITHKAECQWGAVQIECVSEVRIEIALERGSEALAFYRDLLGMPYAPRHAQIPGGLLLGQRGRALYLEYRHDPAPIDARRLLFRATSLAALERRFHEHRWPCRRYAGFLGSELRLLTRDPMSRRLEIFESVTL